MKKRVLVTHNDLDGVGAAILFEYFCKKNNFLYETHMIDVTIADCTLENVYKEILKDNVSHLYIVDLSPKDQSLIEKLSKIFKEKNNFFLKLLDHHEKSEFRFLNYKDWAIFNFNECGTLMLYNELLKTQGFNDIVKFENFAKIVDDYDRFILSIPNSLNMNLLFHLLNKTKFIDRCLSLDFPELFSDEETVILKYINDNNKQYIDKKIESIISFNFDNKNFAIIFADQLANEISMVMRERKISKYDCLAVIDVSKKKVSLRALSQNINVGELASLFHVRGGGHIQSGGFFIEDFKTNYFIKKLFTTSAVKPLASDMGI